MYFNFRCLIYESSKVNLHEASLSTSEAPFNIFYEIRKYFHAKVVTKLFFPRKISWSVLSCYSAKKNLDSFFFKSYFDDFKYENKNKKNNLVKRHYSLNNAHLRMKNKRYNKPSVSPFPKIPHQRIFLFFLNLI